METEVPVASLSQKKLSQLQSSTVDPRMYLFIEKYDLDPAINAIVYDIEVGSEDHIFKIKLPSGHSLRVENCRLVNNFELLELGGQVNSFGGGASLSLGSHRVCTVNLRRISLECDSWEDYLIRLEKRLYDASRILIAHKALIKDLVKRGTQPFIENGWLDLDRMFSTFGIMGYYEAAKDLEERFSENDYLEKMNILRNYLGIREGVEILPEIPQVKIIHGVYADAIKEKARENNPVYDDFRLRLTEAEANVVKAKRERLPDISLNLSVGTTGSHPTFAGAYTNLGSRQIAQVGVSIPILDWGKRRGDYEQAKSDYDLEKDRIEREEDEFNEQVRVLAEDFIAQQELVRIYREADSVAQKRYGIALNRFTVGDISVTDLNYAEQEKDEARQNYIYQLYLSWLYYYNLRYITLYDFEAGCNIAY